MMACVTQSGVSVTGASYWREQPGNRIAKPYWRGSRHIFHIGGPASSRISSVTWKP